MPALIGFQLEHLVKMIIYRHRFSGFVAMPASTAEERARHLDLCRRAMQCALTIIADHVHIVRLLPHASRHQSLTPYRVKEG